MPWWSWIIVVVVGLWLLRTVGRAWYRRKTYGDIRRKWMATHVYLRRGVREEVDELFSKPRNTPDWQWKMEMSHADAGIESWDSHCPHPFHDRRTGYTFTVPGGEKLREHWEAGRKEVLFKRDVIEAMQQGNEERINALRKEWRSWVSRVRVP